MSENNIHNILFFESPSMRELYDTMESWQNANNKRFLSTSILQDGENFCCIALTNPAEVVITSLDGGNHATVYSNGALKSST
jgi:hypothetical protein